jgi:hypothetical protein
LLSSGSGLLNDQLKRSAQHLPGDRGVIEVVDGLEEMPPRRAAPSSADQEAPV